MAGYVRAMNGYVYEGEYLAGEELTNGTFVYIDSTDDDTVKYLADTADTSLRVDRKTYLWGEKALELVVTAVGTDEVYFVENTFDVNASAAYNESEYSIDEGDYCRMRRLTIGDRIIMTVTDEEYDYVPVGTVQTPESGGGVQLYPDPPEFDEDLDDDAVWVLGETFTLTVAASAEQEDGSITYQWYLDDEAIDGATEEDYEVLIPDADDEGVYTCIATHTLNEFTETTTSSECTVTQGAQTPVISVDLAESDEFVSGTPISLSVTAAVTDGGTLTYQWYLDSAAIEGETTDTLTITDPSIDETTGDYYVIVKNTLANEAYAREMSTTCSLEHQIAETPVISGDLTAVDTFITGSPKDLEITADAVSDGGTLSYAWYKDGELLDGEVTDTYSIATAASTDAGTYYCAVTNTLGESTSSVNSAQCALSHQVAETPVLTLDLPLTDAVASGISKDLEVTAAAVSDGGTLSYAWYKDEVLLEGETTDTYNIAVTAPADSGTYQCIVTNTLGDSEVSTESTECVLTVNA